MTDEPYNPKDRRITSRTQLSAWFISALLLASVVAADGPVDQTGPTDQQVAADSLLPFCG